MCGFVGTLTPGGAASSARATVSTMADRLAHRGPDGSGAWVDETAGIALGHRRLAILDVSEAGRQPMASHDGRFVISYNGEIYDHLDVREELGERRWRGHSDTETLLEAVAAWGVEATLRRATGMFAFALWDRRDRVLWLARDRAGEKPCHYGWANGTLVFGSELKALRAFPGYRRELEPRALALYLRYGFVTAPWTIDAGMRKLPPGTYVRFDPQAAGAWPEPVPYWSWDEEIEHGRADPFRGGFDEAVESLDAVLGRAVARQRLSDVPLGAFLSGGVDSTAVVALLQRSAGRPVRTFTIGFDEPEYDESGHANAVAAHLGTDHVTHVVTPSEALSVVPRLATLYDEPFGDASAIPTHLVAALARRDVAVALTGDAGDELFGGYVRYLRAHVLWSRMRRVPAPALASRALGVLPVAALQAAFVGLRLGRHPHRFAQRLAMARAALSEPSIDGAYREQSSLWARPTDAMAVAVEEPASPLTQPRTVVPLDAAIERMMVTAARGYLPDGMLVKVDRAAMAVGLETRVPMLDRDVIRFAWRLPLAYKVEGGIGKRVLRGLVDRYVPRDIVDRPKMGFGLPLDRWLRGPLRSWADDLLEAGHVRRVSPLDPEPLGRLWRDHRTGVGDHQYALWPVLTYLAWAGSADAPTP